MPLGPGWFDSSFDLGHGLEVAFALPGDPTFEAWLEALARALEPVAAPPAQPVPAEQMLEFEPVDWKAWAPPDVVVDPLPKWHSPGPTAGGTTNGATSCFGWLWDWPSTRPAHMRSAWSAI